VAVLLVDGSEEFLEDATQLLEGNRVFAVRNITDGQRRLVEEKIELVLVGPGYAHEPGIAEASLLLDVNPDLPLVLVADGLSTDVLKAALRAGFRDVIDAPLTVRKVNDAVEIIDRMQRRTGDVTEAGRPRVGKVATIMSPKGGAGKTVTSTNVALQLTEWAGPDRVVALDADLQFGDVCISLQVDPKHTIVDAARDIDKLDEQMLASLLSRHPSGLRVLAAPLEPSLADEISTQAVIKILGMLKRMFDYVVVDTAPFLDEPVLSLLERSDVVLLVVDMDLPSVKNAKLALDTLRLIKFPFEKIKLVINRVNSKARLDVDELERSLGLEVSSAVPSDKLVPRSVNEGVPVVALYPRSRVARGFQGVAGLVATNGIAPDGEEDPKGRRWFK
jgi:pilus assembly protein CpaE